MKRMKHMWRIGAAAAAAALMISGCGVTETLSPTGKGEKEYGKAETMVILTTEKLRYENVYTDEIWTAEVDKQRKRFESVLLPQVHDFLIELKTMSNMAEERGIVLTSREKELVSEASAKYYMALGNEHAAEFDLKQSDVAELYIDYWTSEKLVEQLTGDMNLEVSDSEAKVITISQIEISDLDLAEEIWEKTQTEDADFYSIAKAYSEQEEIKKQIYRGMMSAAYEEAAFSLEEGEVSQVFKDHGKYYILQGIDDYDEEATKLRKDQMMREKKTEAFHTSYQAYKAEHPLIGDEGLWNTLSVKACPNVDADFFSIYEEVCGIHESGI